MFEMKLATCETLMGVLPESTDSLKTSYLSRESTYRLVIVDFEVEEVRYAFKKTTFISNVPEKVKHWPYEAR